MSLLLLPLGVGLLAYQAVADRRVAALATLLCLGLIFPARWVAFGDYPYLVDSTLVVPLVLAVARCLEGRWVRTGAVMVGALTLAIWVIHGTEIPTAVVIGLPLWVAILLRRRRAALEGAVAVVAGVALGAVAGYPLTRAPTLPAGRVSGPVVDEAAGYLAGLRFQEAAALRALVGWALSILTAVLVCAGWLVVVRERRGRWLLGSALLPVLCVVDLAGPQLLRPLWSRIYPWGSVDRLLRDGVLRRPRARGDRGGRGGQPRGEAGSPLASRIPPPRRRVVRGGGRGDRCRRPAHRRDRPRRHGVLQHRHPGAGLGGGCRGDPDARDRDPLGVGGPQRRDLDAGQWITALTHDAEAEPKSYAASYPDDWRLVALGRACSDPGGAEAALEGMRAVFVGRQTAGPENPHPWSAVCIASLPDLRLVAGSTAGPAGFLVTG